MSYRPEHIRGEHRLVASVTGVADRFPKALPPSEKLAVLCAPTNHLRIPSAVTGD